MVNAEPPALTNGRGMPVTGMSAVTTIMLMSAWTTSHVVMPQASRPENVSEAVIAIRYPWYAMTTKRATTVSVPTSPHSSPMMAKMKSVDGAGRYKYFCLLSPRPRPMTPPNASAKSDWTAL